MPGEDEYDDDASGGRGGSGGESGGRRGDGASASGGGKAVAGPGLLPIYISDTGLDRYNMKRGTRASDIVPHKLLPKADLQKDLEEMKDACDFWPLRQQIEEYEGPTLLLLRAPENAYDYNYLVCSTVDSYEDHVAEIKEAAADSGGAGARGRRGEGADEGMSDADAGGGDDDDDDDGGGDGYSSTRRGRAGAARGRLGEKLDPSAAAKGGLKRPEDDLSELEIATLHVRSGRPPLAFYIAQARFRFATPVGFDDVDPGEKMAEFRRQKTTGYNDTRRVLERGFQAAATTESRAAQTPFASKTNKAVQCAPISLTDAERDAILHSDALADFVREVYPLLHHELTTNATLDLFQDEFAQFADEEVHLGNRLENSPQVWHSFQHARYSRGKNVLQAQWIHPPPPNLVQPPPANASQQQPITSITISVPGQPGAGAGQYSAYRPFTTTPLVAFAASNGVTFDAWVELSGKVLTSAVLLYSLADVLHPFLVLEVPGNITCFKVHPTHPEYLVAGLMTGQVIFYDLTDAREKVRQHQMQQRVNSAAVQRAQAQQQAAAAQGPGAAAGKAGSSGAAGAASSDGTAAEGGEGEVSLPTIKYTVLSYIDRSHARPVSDLVWLPAQQQMTRKGEFCAAERGVTSQFASVAADGKLLVWDFRQRNDGSAAMGKAAAAAAALAFGGGSLAAKAAQQAAEDPDAKEPKWAPIYSLTLNRPDGSGSSRSGGGDAASGGGGGGTREHHGHHHTLPATKLALGDAATVVGVTEDGDVCELDLSARATEERARPETVKRMVRGHFGAVTSVERSPHFSDIFLTVGDWSFSIWKLGVATPVFTSASANEYLSCGRWSPTRAGIVVTARADGHLDVWDLVDQAHKPSLTFSTGCADALASLEFFQAKGGSTSQYLAAGDNGGRLHVIEVPRNLRRKIRGIL